MSELTAEDLITYCARVSNPSNQTNFETSGKLLRYLKNHQHWSPFEIVSAVFEINTTRDISRQILRHRSFSFQEFSQRYAEKGSSFPDENYRECRMQDLKNRQNSIESDNQLLDANWLAAQLRVEEAALAEYNWALRAGIAKEVARAILPEGLTMSRLYMAGTLRSFIHYIDVRTADGTQKEHQDIAIKIRNILSEHFEVIKQPIDYLTYKEQQ
jgi:thymidylate synthase (FAD)